MVFPVGLRLYKAYIKVIFYWCILYCLYNNDLITELANIPCGVRIQNKSVAAPSFADDVAVIAKFAVSMQHYLDTVNGHSVKWKYNFNTEKIKILIFGKVNKDMCFTINGKKLIIVDGYKHLGVPLCSSYISRFTSTMSRYCSYCSARMAGYRMYCG